MTEPGIELEEMKRDGRKWLEPRFTLGNLVSILATSLVGAGIYYGIIGKIDSQASEIASLQTTVAEVPGITSHLAVIDNTMTLGKQQRDKSMDDMAARLDKLTDAVAQLAQNEAALTATIKATADRP